MPAQTRGFLFSDLRGYSAFVERHGDRAALALLTRYRRMVRDVIGGFGGAEIRTEGDSFYVVFSSVGQAVEAGLKIQAALAAEIDGEPIRAGIGIHAGEVEDDAEQGIVSGAVNIAARICAVAEPSEVLVSEIVRGLTRGYLDVSFMPRGRRRLKGIRDPVAVYRVSEGAAPTDRRTRWPAVALAVGGLTLLVVAIAVMGGAMVREGFGSGVSSAAAPASSSTADATPRGTATGPASSPVVLAIPTFPPESGDGPPPGPPQGWPVPLRGDTTYALAAFRPTISFTPPTDDWTAAVDEPDGFELRWEPGGAIAGYVAGALIQVVYEDPCLFARSSLEEPRPSETRVLPDTPGALVEWLQAHEHLETTSPFPTDIGGYAGLQIDVSVGTAPDCPEGADEPAVERAVNLFPIGRTSFWLGQDENVRIVVVDVDGRPATFLIGTIGPPRFDELISAAQAIIDSIRILR